MSENTLRHQGEYLLLLPRTLTRETAAIINNLLLGSDHLAAVP